MKNVRWMTEDSVPAPVLGYRRRQVIFGKRGLFEFVVGPPAQPGVEEGGRCLKGDGLALWIRLVCAPTCCP